MRPSANSLIATAVAVIFAATATAAEARASAPASMAPITFASYYETHASLHRPERLISADVNGDGLEDVLVTSLSVADVVVHLGRIDGGLEPATNLVTFAAGLRSLAAGDLNDDGALDLVVSETGTVWSLLGNGDGTFQPKREVLSLAYTGPLTIAHLDSDGILDLVVSYFPSPLVLTMKGLGDGGFSVRTSMSTGIVEAQANAVADFDGDGMPDVVVADSRANAVHFMRGLPNAHIDTPVTIPVGETPRHLVTGDFNEDGRPDVAVANGSESTVSVLLGIQGGPPGSRVDYPVFPGPRSIETADVDADGHLDLIVPNAEERDLIEVLRGAGDGTFTALDHFPAGLGANSVVLMDIDLDGYLDAAVGARDADQVNVLPGQGDGRFGEALTAFTIAGYRDVIIGDANLDGRTDVLSIHGAGGEPRLGVHLGQGDGDYSASHLTGGTAWPFQRDGAIADMNGDAIPDVAIVNGFYNRVFVTHGDGQGGFTEAYSQDLPTGVANEPHTIALGDLNHDGRADAVCATPSGSAVMLGQPSGVLGEAVLVGGGALHTTLADLDLDGHQDLVYAASDWNSFFTSPVCVMLGHGDGTFAAPISFDAGFRPAWLSVGDVDNDGKPDVAVANSSGIISILRGLGDGQLTPLAALASPGASCVELADFDADGILDVVATFPSEQSIGVFRGGGGGGFELPLFVSTRSRPGYVRVADVNEDGLQDLLVAYWADDDRFDVLLNTTPMHPTPVQVSLVQADAEPGAVYITWHLAHGFATAVVERRVQGDWVSVGEVEPDGTGKIRFEEAGLASGHYSYRLALWDEGVRRYGGEVSLQVPGVSVLALGRCRWSEGHQGVRIQYAVPSGSARLDVIDVTGRVLATRRVRGETRDGDLVVSTPTLKQPGVYWVRLSQDGAIQSRRFIVLR